MSAAEHLHAVDDDVEDLATFLEGDEPDWDEPPPETGDVDLVNRWLRRLARLQRQDDADQAQANAERTRIDMWLMSRQLTRQGQVEYLELALTQYHRARLARDPKAKTVSLPAGTLKSHAQQPDWTYTDVAAFLDWAKANAPDLVRYPPPVVPPPAPDKNAAKKLLKLPNAKAGDTVQPHLDGEVVPGVQVTVREPKFDIELEGGEP